MIKYTFGFRELKEGEEVASLELLKQHSLGKEFLRLVEPTRIDFSMLLNVVDILVRGNTSELRVVCKAQDFYSYLMEKGYKAINSLKSVFLVTNEEYKMYVECVSEREALDAFMDKYDLSSIQGINIQFLYHSRLLKTV